MSASDRQAALAALNGARPILAKMETRRSDEDVAADMIDLWNGAEASLRALVGGSTLSGQQLVRVARQGELISIDQAHSLLEFLAARERANRTSYKPVPADTAAAREGFQALESALSGAPAKTSTVAAATTASTYAAPQAQSYAAAGPGPANGPASSHPVNAPTQYDAPANTPARGVGRFTGRTLGAIGAGLLLLVLLVAGGLMFAGRRPSDDLSAGIAAMQAGQMETARSEFSKAARNNDRAASPHIFLARLARQDGDLESARRELDTALRLEPKNAIALREMGLILFSSQNYELARRFFIRAAQANPDDPAAQGYLGCSLMRLNRVEEGTRFLRRAGNGAWSACAQRVAAPPPL